MAVSLIERELKVHVVAPETRPLERVLGPDLGDFVRAEHASHGVVFHLGRKPVAIDAKSVILDDGARLDADLVVMGGGRLLALASVSRDRENLEAELELEAEA